MQLFGKKKNDFDLPLASSSSVQGGANAISTFRFPSVRVSNYTFISWVWLLLSFSLILFSYLSCSRNQSFVQLKCPKADAPNPLCQLLVREPYKDAVITPIDRKDVLGSEQVRVDSEGKIIDVGQLSRRERRNLGFSYSLKYTNREIMEAQGTTQTITKTVPMSSGSIGRKNAKSKWMKLNSFIKGEVPDIDVKETKFFTLLGTMGMIAGTMSMMLAGVLGQFWDEPEEKVTKKRH